MSRDNTTDDDEVIESTVIVHWNAPVDGHAADSDILSPFKLGFGAVTGSPVGEGGSVMLDIEIVLPIVST
jgi:hypothetical protein